MVYMVLLRAAGASAGDGGADRGDHRAGRRADERVAVAAGADLPALRQDRVIAFGVGTDHLDALAVRAHGRSSEVGR